MIDAHAHLHDEKYDADREEVITRAFDGGVEKIVTIGTSVAESQDAVDLAENYDDLYATVGMHPHVFNGGAKRSNEWSEDLGADVAAVVRRDRLEEAIYDLEELIDDSEKVVAIGEIGLDHFMPDDGVVSDVQKQWQAEGFEAQIDLAQKHDLPVVVHCRPAHIATQSVAGGPEVVEKSGAYFDCVEIIRKYPEVSFVMHCYMGNQEVTKMFLVMENVIFSFTGNVTFSKKDDDEMSTVIKMIPLERMLIETDAPYLTPAPHRGKRNEPLYVKYVAQRIAHVKDLSVDEVVQQTMQNTKKFYSLI